MQPNYQSLNERLLENDISSDTTKEGIQTEKVEHKVLENSKERKAISLVVGATGETGQGVVHCLIERKFTPNQIRILARTPESAKNLFGEDVEIFKGNVNSLDAIKAALINVTHVFYLTGPRFRDTYQEMQECLVIGLRHIINEGKRLGTLKHIILLSAIAVEWPYHPRVVLLNTFVPGLWAAHIAQERLLRESGLNYTIVRPPRLGPAKTAPEEINISNGKCLRDYVTRAAVAEFMSRCVESSVLPPKVTLKIWGEQKMLSAQFQWNTLFQQVHSDSDDLPSDFENRHIYWKRFYGLLILLILCGIIFLLVWKYAM